MVRPHLLISSTTSQVPAKEELGRAGWTILHRIAAKFSEEPEGGRKKI